MRRDLARAALHHVEAGELTIRRRRNGHGFFYVQPNGRPLRDKRTLIRLKRLAVPPAYEDVVYAADPRAHIQATGRDSAGRIQYRYHPDWEQVRELRKARRLARLIHLLPKIRSAVSRHLRGAEASRDFALAAVVDLVACTALRPGSDSYAQEHGTRGAATLLKSNVVVTGDAIALRFRGKGRKRIEKQVRSRRLARVLKRLLALPGRRLFQYRCEDGSICAVRRRDVNGFLRIIGGRNLTLKDLRTMSACGCALEQLVDLEPRPSQRGRRKQVLAALREVAEELANTPAICRKSYVHAAVIDAFETGALQKLSRRIGGRHSAGRRERLLARVLENVVD
jgi:DNA topoisomerase-1